MKKFVPILLFSLLISGLCVCIARLFKDGRFYLGTLGLCLVNLLFYSVFQGSLEKYRKDFLALLKKTQVSIRHLHDMFSQEHELHPEGHLVTNFGSSISSKEGQLN